MRIAYARVSTDEQNLDLQVNALKRAGYDALFTDQGISGVTTERPGLMKALNALNDGDTLMVWRLDRLARSMRDLTDTVWALHRRGIRFHSICEHIDVGSAFGEFQLHIMSAMAHFERALIVERTRAGVAAAKARGAQIGRKPALNPEEFQEAMFLRTNGMSVDEIAQKFSIGRSTLYRYLSPG